MWPTVLFALLTVAICGWIFTTFRQTRKVHALERSKEEIQVEETLVFDFLHGLGEAFRETIKPHDLHRLIVEGATRILDAHGGALYLADRSGNRLVPVFLSNGCPPLVAVPGHILHQSATTPTALEGFLRMHNIAPGEGLIGTVWQTAQPVILTNVKDVPELAGLRETPVAAGSLMATPLLYGKQNMGVLALGNGPRGAPFSQSDFVVFKSIAEQSAFALYNAIIYSEANEKKRLDHDLEIARDIQRTLLPEKSPSIPGFEIAGINIPARQVSGDYFDYLRVDEHHLGLAIADVSGKGVPAALLMANLQASFRNQPPGALLRPSDVLGTVNSHFFESTAAERFATLFFGIYDDRTRRIRYVNCAHCSPLVLRASGAIDKLDATATMLGAFAAWKCKEAWVDLGRGDTMLVYSDGVTEAGIEHGDEFGDSRLEQVLRENAALPASALASRVIDEVCLFSGASRSDDVTVVALRGA